MKSKTIKIFLPDGLPNGVMTSEIINWPGKLVVCPRASLSKIKARPEVRRPGVYCLVGADPDYPARDRVYIGESDNVFTRLVNHDRENSHDFWTRTCIVSGDENLTKAHIRYLESRVIEIARTASRSTIENRTAPPRPHLPESDVASTEDFLAQLQLLLPVLSFGFLQPKPVASRNPTPAESCQEGVASSQGVAVYGDVTAPTFVIDQVGVKAFAREIGGEFVVMAGSTARREGTQSWTGYRKQRDGLVHEGILVEDENPELYKFVEDTPFPSPSAAANVVLARQSNGRTEWKMEGSGKTYADWHEEKGQSVSEVSP